MKRILYGFCILAVIVMAFASCGDKSTGDPSKPKVTVVSIEISGAKTEFNLGESFSMGGLKVTVTYSNAATQILTPADFASNAIIVDSSEYKKDTVGTYTITVKCQGLIKDYDVSVINPETTVSMPVADPSGGVYALWSLITLTLSCSTDDAEIWYTVNGNTPTNSSPSIKYNPGSTISMNGNETKTVKAQAYKTGLEPSAVMTAVYTVVFPPALSAGSVNRTSDTAATIGFTTDTAGTAYYLVVPIGTAAPSATAVREANKSLGAVTAGAITGKAVTLSAGAMDIYVIVEDNAGYISLPLKIIAAAHIPGPPFTGSGIESSPYLINNAADLVMMRILINASDETCAALGVYYKLTADIALTGEWTPIGSGDGTYSNQTAFEGIFDGGGHTISNVTINRPGLPYNGIFGFCKDAIIRNLGVITSAEGIVGGNNTGGIMGCDITGTTLIENCYVSGTVTGGDFTGGITGQTFRTIKNCYSLAKVIGGNYVGGIAGDFNNSGSAENCYAAGAISGSNFVGGILGRQLTSGASVNRCVALNPTILRSDTGTGVNFGRISGNTASSGLSNNAAYNIMKVLGRAVTNGTQNNGNGAGIVEGDEKTEDLYSDSPRSWKFGTGTDETSPWRWGLDSSYMLPTLWWQKAAPALPGHLNGESIILFEGTGGGKTPYLIKSAADLALLRDLVNSEEGNYSASGVYYKMTADIALSGSWTAIGTNGTTPFRGILDGDYKEITGLNINHTTSNYSGLFGYLESGMVTNLQVSGTVNAYQYAGFIVGYNHNGVISSCRISAGSSITGYSYTGGITGWSTGSSARITTCSYEGDFVKGYNQVGGIVGCNEVQSTVMNCRVSGNIEATNNMAGGIAGFNYSSAKIMKCYAEGSVKSSAGGTGGIVGHIDNAAIEDCVGLQDYILTDVDSYSDLGRVVGNFVSGTLTNNYGRNELVLQYDNGTGSPSVYRPDPRSMGTTTKDGATVRSIGYFSATWWQDTANYTVGEWIFNDDAFPVLIWND